MVKENLDLSRSYKTCHEQHFFFFFPKVVLAHSNLSKDLKVNFEKNTNRYATNKLLSNKKISEI